VKCAGCKKKPNGVAILSCRNCGQTETWCAACMDARKDQESWTWLTLHKDNSGTPCELVWSRKFAEFHHYYIAHKACPAPARWVVKRSTPSVRWVVR
jgi:hypothetical protein